MALSTRFPLALFPIRIETRFATEAGAPVLMVRIFPDTIHVDAHELPLTTDEVAAHDAWLASARELGAWRQLIASVGARRADYLASLAAGDRAAVGTRAETWTRAPRARLLPAEWVVVVRPAGQPSIRVRTSKVVGPLALGISPGDPGEVSREAIDLAGDSAWLASYAEAVRRGMAITIALPPAAATADRFDVIAYGLPDAAERDDTLAEAGAQELAGALAAHRFGEGLGVLGVGEATNHTGAGRAPWTSTANDPEITFARISAAPETDGDGSVADAFGRALGIGTAPFARLGGGDHAAFDRDVAATHALLWPATLGYFFEHMLDGVPRDPSQVERVREAFVAHVRNRGPLPILRVGRSPYGVLPVSSLARWVPRDAEPFDPTMVDVVRDVVATWRKSIERVPRLGADGDGVVNLTSILSRAPVSTSYVARSVVGPAYATYLYDFIRMPLSATWWARQHEVARVGWQALRRATTALPRIARSVFAGESVPIETAMVLDRAAAVETSLGELVPLDLAALRARGDRGSGTPLVYRLARHGLLASYLHAARSMLEARGEGPFVEPELVGIAPGRTPTPTPSPWTWLDQPASPGGTETIGAHLDRLRETAGVPAFAAARAGLARMATLAPQRVEALVREALDLCAHRIDAWSTAIASARLSRMRVVAPRGVLVGAYGWTEGLRRDHVTPVREPIAQEPAPIRDSRGAGYVHAPSLAHATTAALLRSGALAHGTSADSPFALDLESARARIGRDVLDAVRAGVSLGAVLGRRFERALVASRTPILGDHVTAFRRFASTADPAATTDAARIARVVDGHALVMRRAQIPWGHHELPPVDSVAQRAIDRIIDDVANAVDATADVLTAEAVHQLGNGDSMRAGAIAEVASRGAVPPAELDVLDHRAQGIGLEHRVAIVVPAAAVGTGWSSTIRARLAPTIDAWCAAMLGPASTYAARVIFLDGETLVGSVTITLDMLGIAAVDAALSAGDLTARVLDVANQRRPASLPGSARPVLTEDRVAAATIGDARSIAAELGRVIAAARPLHAADAGATLDGAAIAVAEAAVSDGVLDDVLGLLASDARRGLSAAAALGVPGSVPAVDRAAWPAQVASATAVLETRRARLATLPPHTGTLEARVEHLAARIAAIAGDDLRFTPPLRLVDPAGWNAALANQPALVGGDPTAVPDWLSKVARVREPLTSLERVVLLADVLAPRPDAALDLRVIQVPVEPWIGGATFRSQHPPVARAALVVHVPLGVTPVFAGLLVDTWSETLPSAKATTGLAFHYDQPGAQAPQAILLAVPPDDAPVWAEDTIESILGETIDLVHVRPLDSELVNDAGHYIPALYFAINLAGDTASTDFFSERG